LTYPIDLTGVVAMIDCINWTGSPARAKDRMVMQSPPHSPGFWAPLGLALLSACTSPQGLSQPPAPDAELSAFLPPGTSLGLTARGDMDGDGDQDAAIVLDGGEGEAARQPRTLLLLRRDADGRLQRAIESPRAISCRRCGGMIGDPLQGIRIAPGAITLRFEGGSRELWSKEFRFTPAPGGDDWWLTGVTHLSFDRADGGKGTERKLSAEEIGEVSLASFDASEFPADALP
jgi:hypothetical protein